MHWLLTRPYGHNRWLAAQLRQLGQQVSIMPSLLVEAWHSADEAPAWEALGRFNGLLFTSVNAVSFFASGLEARRLRWPQHRYFAIGSATAAALAKTGRQVIAPSQGFTSEALLALPQLQAMAGRRLLLVSGRGGRGLLEPALLQAGVAVTRLDVYQRRCNPNFSWPALPVDGVLVTSLESWHCLLGKAQQTLQYCVVIAGSERIGRETAKIAPTRVAASPHDTDMLATLKEECP